MVKDIKKQIFVTYDLKQLELALETVNAEYNNGDKYQQTQENAIKRMRLIRNLFDSIERQEVEIDGVRPETEEEAKEYFGSEFVKAFEELRRECDKTDITLAIHGTDIEAAKAIMKEGLNYKNPELGSTMVQQESSNSTEEYNKYSELLNWPHREYKGLVLVGVPNECYGDRKDAMPLWQHYAPEKYDYKYKIKSEFIIGYIDVLKREIVKNEKYTITHNYSELIHDLGITREGANYESEVEESDSNFPKETDKIEKVDMRKLDDGNRDEMKRIFNALLLQGKDGIPEEKFTYFEKELQEIHDKIQETLKYRPTNEQVSIETGMNEQEYIEKLRQESLENNKTRNWDDEIQETISDIRLQDINDVTKDVKSSELEIENTEDLEW